MIKSLRAPDKDLVTKLESETRNIAATAASRDGGEGVAAFLARRKPVFTGA